MFPIQNWAAASAAGSLVNWMLTSPLFLESLSSYHFMLNMDGKGSPNLTFCVYPALKVFLSSGRLNGTIFNRALQSRNMLLGLQCVSRLASVLLY